MGGGHRDFDRIGSKLPTLVNVNMGYAASSEDAGQPLYQDGSFILKADGTINQPLNQDFWYRAMYEQAVKTKALVVAYYGQPPKYSYLDGHSQGGRQALKIAQVHPELYDGYMVAAPAINVTKMSLAALYPQLVMKTDLGITGLDTAQATNFQNKVNVVNALAVAACDAEGLGYLVDPFKCNYNPATKAEALCTGVTGDGGAVGTNATATCLSLAEAHAIDRIWYGATTDGAFDTSQSYDSRSGKSLGPTQLWWAWTIGWPISAITAPMGTDWLAMVNQDASYASSIAGSYTSAAKAFVNASTSVRDNWKNLSYAGLTEAFSKGLALQQYLGNPNTDNADLSGARDLNRKILMHGGLADNSIPTAGWINYYNRVLDTMGGVAAVQSFFRMYMIPGMMHSSTGMAFTVADGPARYPDNKTVPMPLLPGATDQTPTEAQDQMFTALKNWVENGVAPGNIVISSSDGSVSYPICAYPKKITWDGVNSSKLETSYSCR